MSQYQSVQAPRSRTFFELLSEQASARPSAVALIADQQHWSYDALHAHVLRAVEVLQRLGVRRGSKVGLLMPNQFEWLQLFFAANALGAVVVPVSTWSTRSEIEFLANDAAIQFMFVRERFTDRALADDVAAIAPQCKRLQQCIVVGDNTYAPTNNLTQLLASADEEPARFNADQLVPGSYASAADVAFQLYTSGSSAFPKAVPLLQFAAIENGFNIGERMGLTPADNVFIPVPLFWSYGAVNALPATLSHGATLVLQRQFDAGEALGLIDQHQCSAIYTLPAITNALLSHAEFSATRTRSLRTGLTIGTPQDVLRTANDLGAHEICNVYGSTESYGNCAVTPHHWPLSDRAQCQGPLLPGVEARIRDPESLEVCAPEQVGALEVRGYITPGYVGASAALNAATFSADGFFATGDLASQNQAGHIQYAGRSSEMIKRSGINVSPAEIEQVLQRLPAVGMVGITGSPDPRRGERIVAFITLRPGSTLSDDEILQHCREYLSAYKLPDVISFRDELPLTPTGKLLRKELKRLAAELR